MKVLLDHQIFMLQKFGGISRYFYELLSQAQSDPHNEIKLRVKYSNNAYITAKDFSNHLSIGENIKFKGKNRLISWYNQRGLKEDLEKADIFHPTFYQDYYLDQIQQSQKPFVLTVYDMINEKLPQYFDGKDNIPALKKKLMKKANLIFAISESTKQDIIELCQVPEEKIITSHLASSLGDFIPNKNLQLPDRYILFTGNRESYKNFQHLYIGIKDLLPKYQIKLLCAGSSPFSDKEIEQFNQDQTMRYLQHVKFKDNHDLRQIYRKAQLFVFPSQYEGFGIPTLEAFASGCPVVLANNQCFKEIGEDAAIYFDPLSNNDIQEKVEFLLKSDQEREHLIKKGNSRILDFSWEKTYAKTVEGYKSLL